MTACHYDGIDGNSLEKLLVGEKGKQAFLLYVFLHPEDSVSNAAAKSTGLFGQQQQRKTETQQQTM